MADQDGLNTLKDNLLELECPFTWDMIDYDTNTDVYRNYDEDYIPELKFMRLIVSSFNHTTKAEYQEAENKLKEAVEVGTVLESSKTEVAKHIFEATKLHFLIVKGENLDDVKELLEKIVSIKGDEYSYQLNEFKSAGWHCCKNYDSALENALKFAQFALEKNPESALSHFLVANTMKLRRKIESIHSYSTSAERKHLGKAYDLSKNPHIGITFAVVLRQDGDLKKTVEVCKEIYDLNLESTTMQLRLAANFTNTNEHQLARKCLDFVEQKSPDDTMFLHYKGQYLMKIGNFLEAAMLLKKACDAGKNYAVEMAYANCIKKTKFPFNFVAFFKEVYEKYSEDCEDSRKQEMLLHIAFSNFFDNMDIRKATKYFLKAFEIDAECEVLRKYRCPLTGYVCHVYWFLENDLFPKIYNLDRQAEETIAAMGRLQNYCDQFKAASNARPRQEVEEGMASLSVDSSFSTSL